MKKETCFYSSGSKIAAMIGYPDDRKKNERYPAIVINHGYSGNKEEYGSMAQALNNCGYVTLQFDSRGCGGSQGEPGRMMCSTEWVEDAFNAVTFISAQEYVNSKRIGFTGCSMGGAITLYMSANDPRVKCSVAMAPFSDGEGLLRGIWTERKGREAWKAFVEELEEDSRDRVLNNRSRLVSVPYALCMLKEDEEEFLQSRRLDPSLVRDIPLESVGNSFLNFRPVEHCPRVNIPLMLIHGLSDSIVPPWHSEQIYKVLTAKKERVLIEGAPHSLPTSSFKDEVFKHALAWFDANLQ